MNVSEQDQFDAAQAEAETRLRDYADDRGVALTSQIGPVAKRVGDAWAETLDRALACVHAAQSPMPVYGWADVPGVIRCAECHLRAAHRRAGVPEDSRCDGCRRQSVWLHAVIVLIGAATLTMGLCPSCLGENGP